MSKIAKFTDIKEKIDSNGGFEMSKDDLKWFNEILNPKKKEDFDEIDQVTAISTDNYGLTLNIHTKSGKFGPIAWFKDGEWNSWIIK